jgi:hypothetical protein
MPSFEDGPALRIPHVVRGRAHVGTRVHYLVDAKGEKPDHAAPERVVLKRWRKRRKAGVTFTGTRLSPTVWRALHLVLDTPSLRDSRVTPERLEARLEEVRKRLKEEHLTAPACPHLAALVALCGPERLQALIDRHQADLTRPPQGVPDLFLYARGPGSRLHTARFVEVKKPEEPVSAAQGAEIEFLRSLRLPARVLRLMDA